MSSVAEFASKKEFFCGKDFTKIPSFFFLFVTGHFLTRYRIRWVYV